MQISRRTFAAGSAAVLAGAAAPHASARAVGSPADIAASQAAWRRRPTSRVTLGSALPQAHAHNDYEHPRPLLDALTHGFTSVEADVWLVDGDLRVAHDPWELDGAPTLREAYLEPLARLASPNGKQILPDHSGPFQLLIDIKSDGEQTWPVIEAQLAEHDRIVTRVRDGRVRRRAVQAVISGDRPREAMLAARTRRSFFDGRPEDLASGLPTSFMPLVSANWTSMFTWHGLGQMPAFERRRLDDYVGQAHAAGYRVRFWATNDLPGRMRENLWTTLAEAGVDHINTDDLAGLRAFLTGRGRAVTGS